MPSQLPTMSQQKSMIKALNEIMQFRDNFLTIMAEDITALYRIGNFKPWTKIKDIPFDTMSIEETQDYLNFQTYFLSRISMFHSTYVESVNSTDIKIHDKVQTATM